MARWCCCCSNIVAAWILAVFLVVGGSIHIYSFKLHIELMLSTTLTNADCRWTSTVRTALFRVGPRAPRHILLSVSGWPPRESQYCRAESAGASARRRRSSDRYVEQHRLVVGRGLVDDNAHAGRARLDRCRFPASAWTLLRELWKHTINYSSSPLCSVTYVRPLSDLSFGVPSSLTRAGLFP